MEEETPKLPVSEQETQIQAPSFFDKLKIHKLKILGGFLGVLVLAGAVFGAYKIGQRQVQPGPQPTPTPVATPTPDLTANWETYTNDFAKFSLKYAPSMALTEKTLSDQEKQIVFTGVEGTITINAAVPESSGWGGGCDPEDQKEINFLGKPTKICGGITGINQLYGTHPDGYSKIQIGAIFAEPYADNREIILRMLSTFRFLEEGEGWKSYSNTELKFSLKCPEGWYVYNIDPSSILITSLSHKPAHDEKYTGLLIHFRTDLTPETLAESRKLIKWTVDGVKISGIDGFKVYPSSQAEIQSPEVDWYFPNRTGTGTFEIQGVCYIGDKESNLKTFDQILSTFRFLE